MDASQKPDSASANNSGAMPRELFGYEVIAHIGSGAGSELYAVTDRASAQVYALKHVVRTDDKSARFIEQLQNEYAVGSKLNNHVIRRVYALKEQRTLLRKVTAAVLIVEHVDGMPLDANLPTELPALVRCFLAVADGLQALHNAGFVHCDLKPNNILLDGAGKVKVIDLGQACPTGTAKSRIQGTPDYISPEQVKCKPVSNRTDIFNLGATMYWALTGKKLPTLFTLKRDENSLLAADLMESPRQLNPLVPEAFSSLVMECVRSDEHKRPQDMTEVRRRLELTHHLLTRATRPTDTSVNDLEDALDLEDMDREDSASLSPEELISRNKLNDGGSADLPQPHPQPGVVRSIGPRKPERKRPTP
jgi:serine/threonine-protein kinase